MTTEPGSPHGLRDMKDHWNAVAQAWGWPEQLAQRVVPTGQWLVVRDWMTALRRLVRRVILQAALGLLAGSLVSSQARARRKARARPKARTEQTPDPSTWRLRFAVLPSPQRASKSGLRKPRASASPDCTPYEEPPPVYLVREESPPRWLVRERNLLRRQEKLVRAAAVSHRRRLPVAPVWRPGAPPFMETRKVARQFEAVRRALVNFDAVALRFARRLQRIREAAHAQSSWGGLGVRIPEWPDKTLGRRCTRATAQNLEPVLRQAIIRFNTS